jgi:hypothetical protein
MESRFDNVAEKARRHYERHIEFCSLRRVRLF